MPTRRCLADARPRFEVTRYRTGDFLGAHSDTLSARRIALVFNFSRGEEGSGGDFGHRDEHGNVHTVPPRFNTLAAFPLRTDCKHWVDPVGPGFTRYTLAVHCLAAPAGT